MNWLSHIYFTEGSEESILGNFLGDFISNVPWKTCYNESIVKGIMNHLKVDQFASSHPVFQKSCRRISDDNTFYSIILIDIFYDHFLAKNWPIYSTASLSEYVTIFYEILRKNKHILPDKLCTIMPKLIEENWLVAYRSFDGIQNALNRVAQRMKHSNTMGDCLHELTDNYDGFEEDFQALFPAIFHHVSIPPTHQKLGNFCKN